MTSRKKDTPQACTLPVYKSNAPCVQVTVNVISEKDSCFAIHQSLDEQLAKSYYSQWKESMRVQQIHVIIDGAGPNDVTQHSCRKTKPQSEFIPNGEQAKTLIVKLSKTLFALLQIYKTCGGLSQANLGNVLQEVHDNVMRSAKFDTKFQKDTFNDVCALANKIAQDEGWSADWFEKEKIYRTLMSK